MELDGANRLATVHWLIYNLYYYGLTCPCNLYHYLYPQECIVIAGVLIITV